MGAQPTTQIFSNLVDLVSAQIGGEALLCSDDFFASMDNLIQSGRGVFIADKYTERGKWMDGWESRRRRTPGHDWCILKLGVAGRVRGFDIDTNHFMGNHAPFASVDACFVEGDISPEHLRDRVEWTEILPASALERGSQNIFAADIVGEWTHIRLNIYPDGGVARLRVFGEPQRSTTESQSIDLASVAAGGQTLACSDMFFSPMINLISPGRAENMGEGWETRRRRGKGWDWIVVQLGQPGILEKVELDTHFFKGNYPDQCALEGLYWPDAPAHMLANWESWHTLIPPTHLQADHNHSITDLKPIGPISHIRLRVLPCGGVSRLRAFGKPVEGPQVPAPLQRLNTMSNQAAGAHLARACGSSRWVQAMLQARPFRSHEELFGRAEQIWWQLGDKDWLEAFGHHPRIGADIDSLRKKFAATSDLSEREQAGVVGASEETLQGLCEGNKSYEDLYGFIFIVCASGKSAEEMLGLLKGRMHRERDQELRVAAGEQLKITKLRLASLEEES